MNEQLKVITEDRHTGTCIETKYVYQNPSSGLYY